MSNPASLKPTSDNARVVGVCFSAADWVRAAIGGDKCSGKEGFENYRDMGGWYHPIHYKHISKQAPNLSPPEALAEMTDVRLALLGEMLALAAKLDDRVVRLQRMEEQIGEVVQSAKGAFEFLHVPFSSPEEHPAAAQPLQSERDNQ